MNKLLITGTTGFVGGAVLALALSDSSIHSFLLLVRAPSPEEGVVRIRSNLAKFGCGETVLNKINEDNILLGDLACPDDFLSDPRLACVTHVINSAAVASFGDNSLIWKVNVEGTLKFAKRMADVPGLIRFVHVGTAMSCVPEAGTVVVESMEHRLEEEHLVQYTWSKSTIEQLMTEECPRLPLVIARPSIIVGHTQEGCRPSSSIFWVFRMVLMLGKFMCSMEDKIDIIPVDYCAKALLLLAKSTRLTEKVYHISAGDTGSTQFIEIDAAMAKALNQHPIYDSYQQVDYSELVKKRRDFKTIYGPCNERLMLRAMRLYGEFSMLNVCFSNKKLLDLGMSPPPRFVDYIHRCVETTYGFTIPELMQVDFK